MGNTAQRSTHNERRRIRYRRNRRMMRRLCIGAISVALIVIVIYIVKLKNYLTDINQKLDRMAVVQYETAEELGDTGEIEQQKEADYVNSIAVINLEKPVQRSRAEAVQKLSILGNGNEIIADIYKNNALYSEDMLIALANNPEMAGFVSGYLEAGSPTEKGLTASEKEQAFPLFLQWDTRWGYESYGDDSNIGLAGCGPTCMSMVLFSLLGEEKFTPDKIAAYSMENGYYVAGTGTAWALMEELPLLYGIKVMNVGISDYEMKQELDKGRILLATLSEGDFTAAGHFIVIYGYDENGFKVNDSNSVSRSREQWTFERIGSQIKNIWSYYK